METMKGKCASSRIDLGYTELFCISEVIAGFLSSCDSGLGTLWCCFKHIEAPYDFDWEQGIVLHPMQRIRASFRTERDISWDFSSCGKNLGYILELQRGWPFVTQLSSAKSRLLSS